MSVLRVHALGQLRVLADDARVEFPTTNTRYLLCYLLLRAGQPMEREQIAEGLWPLRPPGKALHSLATSMAPWECC